MSIPPITQKIASLLSEHGVGPSPGSSLKDSAIVREMFKQLTLLAETSEDPALISKIAYLLDNSEIDLGADLERQILAIEQIAQKRLLDAIVLTKDEAEKFKGPLANLGNDRILSSKKIIEGALGVTVSNEDSAIAKQILDETILCTKENRTPDFSFLGPTPKNVAMLFKLVDFLCMYDFQRKHLEPFSEKFPGIPLEQTPETIFELTVLGNMPEDFDFTRFVDLERLNAFEVRNLTWAHIKTIAPHLKVLHLPDAYWRQSLDFSKLSNAEKITSLLGVLNASNPMNDLVHCKKLKVLHFPFGCDVTHMDFSQFPDLEDLDLNGCEGLGQTHLDQLSQLKNFKTLKLHTSESIESYNFSGLRHLEIMHISLPPDQTVTQAQINQLLQNLKTLILSNAMNVEELNFSRLNSLERLGLSAVTNLTVAQIQQFPDTLTSLSLPDKIRSSSSVDEGIKDVNFAQFPRLKNFSLFYRHLLTDAQKEYLTSHGLI